MFAPLSRTRSFVLSILSLLALTALSQAQAPVAQFSGTPVSGVAPLDVAFTDFSTGTVTSWFWTFGDVGTSTLEDPVHTYTAPGTYTVSLTVVGPGGSDTETKTGYVTVLDPPPIADFSGAPLAGIAPLTVNFTNAITGGATTSRFWDFGDLGTSTELNPSHTYTAAGSYTVSLTASGPGGVDSEIKTAYVVVSPPPPVAAFSGAPLSGAEGMTSYFTDLSTGGVTSWSWDFGDSGTSSVQNPSHVYAAAGTYTVSLTVTAPGGMDSETKVGYVVVSEHPPIADFSGAPLSGLAPLTVNFTNLTSGGPATGGDWTFGDGGTSTALNPSHTYANAGKYTVSLTATGPGGVDTETKFEYVTVIEPPPAADFSASPLSGVAPLSVAFTDLTAGMVTGWSWTFGDGGSSSSQNPSRIYTQAGTYTVTLTAVGPGGTDVETKVDYVTVTEPAPVAEFTGTPRTGHVPFTTTFKDLSLGNTTAWSWDFGDGGTSTQKNPSHSYTVAGTYTVSLTVTSAGGMDTKTKVGYVVATDAPPIAEFAGTPLSGVAPLSVNFTNLTGGGPATGGDWDFGDAATSSELNPTHVYTTPGVYTVSLTATGPGGVDTETKVAYVTVLEPPPVAEFAGTQLSGPNPLLSFFTDLSTGMVTSWSWDFGDGGTSTLQNPTHSYTSPGVYSVSLTATGPGGSDTNTKLGYVVVADPVPVAEFSGLPIGGLAPLTVDFTNLSTDASSASWTFGDSNFSTALNPQHTYTTAGVYTVSLTATGPGGSSTETKYDYITVIEPPPTTNFVASPTSGTAPRFVSFSNLTTGMVTAWSWSFGDGGTSTLRDPGHTYTEAGSYTVSLTAIGPGGVDVETKVGYITINEPVPVAQFSGTPLQGAYPLQVQFTDFSSGSVTAWSWNFGDGGTSTVQHPSHTYATAGSYTVTLDVTSAGGSDGETKVGYVVVGEPPPIADFSANVLSGLAPLTVTFTPMPSGGAITSGLWNFGDNSTTSAIMPSHTYTAPGLYTVSLTLTGPGGVDSEVKNGYIQVVDQPTVAEFSATPLSGDAPLDVTFSDLSTGDVTSWMWDFGDGNTSTEQNPVHNYVQGGSFTVSLTASGPAGPDTETKVDYVVLTDPAPTAEFSGTPLSGALPLTVNFTDLSTPGVSAWSWDFGDGGSSALQNPSHVYSALGVYTVSLTVTSPGGMDMETKVDYVVAGTIPTLDDGSFEMQVAGTPPAGAWSITFGAGHVVNPVGPASDNGMPALFGSKWCELAADSTTAATPPSNPGGPGLPPVGAAGVSQTFAYPSSSPHLLFSAAFVLAGPAADASFNDFMSVDISDGTTTHNIYYRDSFSAFPNVSTKHGLPMTVVSQVFADLQTLFPASTPSTVFTLSAEVGNGGDGLTPSKGYVDAFRLGPFATSTTRNGTGVNALCYSAITPPTLGTTWTTRVDHSGHPGATATVIIGRPFPSTGPILSYGEVLIAGPKFFQSTKASAGTEDLHSLPLPFDTSFSGLSASVQPVILGGAGAELCNAIDILLGF